MAKHSLHPDGFSRIETVLEIIPTSRTSFYRGIKEGRYPAPVRIGPNQAAWRNADILALVERLGRSDAA